MRIKKLLTLWGWPLIVLPLAMSYLGGTMNEIAVWKNGGQMPVYSVAYTDHIQYQYFKATHDLEKDTVPNEPDYIHKEADKNTKVPYLCDFIVGDGGISSLGDLLIDLGGEIRSLFTLTWAALLGVCLYRKESFHL